MNARRCPALFVSAPASGQGKTTVTAALAQRYRAQGKRVRVFKTGPDFLDPMILARASGTPVYQLDLWMGGAEHCHRLLYDAAGAADLILIEGVMGLFDGAPSSADLAAHFGVPVLLVIDGSAMAQTFGAVAHGLARYRADVRIHGVIANRVAGAGHFAMLRDSLPKDIKARGWLARTTDIALPERHLGLLPATEIADLDSKIACAAERLDIDDADALPEPVSFEYNGREPPPAMLAGVRIGVAHDAAFSFVYPANLDTLRDLGAELIFFSPLHDAALPLADALYLPGGYPELHLSALQQNTRMYAALRAHHAAGKPIVAECGGMLYLLDSLTDMAQHRADMVGLLPGNAIMQSRLSAIAMQQIHLPEGELRGHTFHYSRLDTTLPPIAQGRCPNGHRVAEPVFRRERLTASYIHSYFPSNPSAAAQLFLP